MNERIYTVAELQSHIAPIAARYGVERVYVFGSHARGDATPASDVDLRIDRGSLRGMFALSGMRLDICRTLSKNVDLLTTGSLDDDFRKRIGGDEVLIYNRDNG